MGKIKRYVLHLHEGNVTYEQKQHEEKSDTSRQFYRTVGMASELGFVLAFPLVAAILSGSWLDRKFSSYPKFTLSLLILGVIVSFCNMFAVMKEYLKKEKKQ